MTQVMISQKYKKTCDGCGLVKEYEMVEPSEAQIVEMTSAASLLLLRVESWRRDGASCLRDIDLSAYCESLIDEYILSCSDVVESRAAGH